MFRGWHERRLGRNAVIAGRRAGSVEMDAYPLKFEPLCMRRVWGGRRLAELLGRSLPPDEPIGETWEIADLENAQTKVANGPARGKTLHELVAAWGADLTGRAALVDGRFPLLIKFLDARETLSVQVHPDEATARRLGGAVRVKHEAWYVLAADAGAFLYLGLAEGVDRERFAAAVAEGTVERLLRKVPVKPGQCFYLPSGTVHALGAGIVVAEVQTPSDVTFRVFDWNRVDPSTGRRRDLHVAEALECIRFGPLGRERESRSHVASLWTAVTRLAACPSFVLEKVRMVEGLAQDIPYAEPVVWIMLEGQARVTHGRSGEVSLAPGDVLLLPAALRDGRVHTKTDCVWLEVTVPVPSDLSGLPRPDSAYLRGQPGTAEHPIPLGLPKKEEP